MLKRSLLVALTLTGLTTVLAPDAQAQIRNRYPYNYGFTQGRYPYYYSNIYPPAETSVHYQPQYHAVYYPGLGYSLRYEQTGSLSPVWTGYQGFTPVTPASQTLAGSSVTLDVRVPTTEAVVTVDGHPTTQSGTSRRYSSPPLSPGKTYEYEVKAHWHAGGQLVERTQKVQVRAGDRIAIDFLAAGTSR